MSGLSVLSKWSGSLNWDSLKVGVLSFEWKNIFLMSNNLLAGSLNFSLLNSLGGWEDFLDSVVMGNNWLLDGVNDLISFWLDDLNSLNLVWVLVDPF